MLKSLELFGFKSFADRTRFDFAPGVTCVVGPNGSGKSNVVDAIKWILGDQSPKSLRGKEMTDVIFNGSSNRKPAGLAEALLTFDNSRRFLGVDADEVQVGRRIYRSGEAEYLINRTPARLKDIKDLFLGTGAGTSAYSIIEQGRVDQLLQATNINRRNVFEEAAGISRFKVKKIDAQRKLERVAQNLLRLTDIVKEVETQLLATRSQAAKAAKFREYSQELRTLRIGSAADDYRDHQTRLVAIDDEREQLQAQVAELTALATDCEVRQKSAESQLAEAEDRLRAAERREAENREAIAGYDATVRHQTARRQELDAEYTRLQTQQSELTVRAEEVAGELEKTVDDLQVFADELARRQAAVGGATQTIRELGALVANRREQLERSRALLLESVRQMSMIGSRVAGWQLQHDNLALARDSARTQLAALEIEVARCRIACAEHAHQVQAHSAGQQALRESLRDVQTQRCELSARHADHQQTLAEMREQRGAIQARKALLEDLERRQEGLGVGVKEILTLARESAGSPWNQVLGHVVDLLEVDLENAALLEVALGNRAQLIVLDEGEPLLRFLNEGNCRISGRVGFLALAPDGPLSNSSTMPLTVTDPSPGSAQCPDLSGRPGVVCRADRLVRSASGVHHLPERLLSDTWIVATLDAALKLSRTAGQGCRYVTLQGELLEANGALFVGSVKSESSLVSRKSELRGIRNDVARLDHQIAAEEAALELTTAESRDLVQQEQQIQFDLDLASHHLAELRTAGGSKELDLERVERNQTDAQSDLDRTLSELEQVRPHLEAARSELARFEVVQQTLQQEIEDGERQIALELVQQQQLQTLYAAEERDLAMYEERLKNLHSARTRLDQERFQRELHREEAERRFQMLALKREQIELEILNTTAALAELTSQNETVSADVARLQQEREVARRLRSELSEQELNVRHQLRDVKERSHTLEMQETDIRHQSANIADRLRDEYQLELSDVAGTDVSARRDYLRRAGSVDESEHPAADPTPEVTPDQPLSTNQTDGFFADSTGALPLAVEVREKIEEQINRLRRKLRQVGQVNADSLQELDDLEARFARLSGQLQDLVEANSTLEEIIRRINTESKRLFVETFDQIRENFRELFRKLFGGGEGDVVLENPDDVLECGIDVVARPPGKELRSISLLSGGEKTMTAVALLLAIFKSKPSPFCILDEVDAALDEGNVNRYLGIIREFQQWTQFIVVTHHKRTMSGADVLYGVTMEEAGISKRMSVRFEDISEDGHFPATGSAPPAATGSAEMTTAA